MLLHVIRRKTSNLYTSYTLLSFFLIGQAKL
jgi:hypothetical protein